MIYGKLPQAKLKERDKNNFCAIFRVHFTFMLQKGCPFRLSPERVTTIFVWYEHIGKLISIGSTPAFILIAGADLECKTRWWPIFPKSILFILQLLLIFVVIIVMIIVAVIIIIVNVVVTFGDWSMIIWLLLILSLKLSFVFIYIDHHFYFIFHSCTRYGVQKKKKKKERKKQKEMNRKIEGWIEWLSKKHNTCSLCPSSN